MLEKFTSYNDTKGKQWVLVDISFYDENFSLQLNPQFVVMYEFGTIGKCYKLPYNAVEAKVKSGELTLIKPL